MAVSCVAKILKQHAFSISRVKIIGGESILLYHLLYSVIFKI
jgi:hypothetical protein